MFQSHYYVVATVIHTHSIRSQIYVYIQIFSTAHTDAGRAKDTFVDPNSWIRDVDFGRAGLHLNRNGAGQLGDLYTPEFVE